MGISCANASYMRPAFSHREPVGPSGEGHCQIARQSVEIDNLYYVTFYAFSFTLTNELWAHHLNYKVYIYIGYRSFFKENPAVGHYNRQTYMSWHHLNPKATHVFWRWDHMCEWPSVYCMT